MLYNTAYNCLPVEAGLIKAEIPALDKINPSANSVQQAVLRAAVTTEQDFTANVYLLPAKSVAADCETCLRLYQKTFPAGKTNFDIDITDIFQQSSADAAYVRVAPVADAAFKLSGRVEITIEASRPTNAVTREKPTEARLGVDAGSLGSASVNLRDGSLSFSHADMTLGGGKTAFSLVHVYHGVSYDTDEIFSGVSAKTGKGWKTNFHQFLAGSDKSASYVDASGTEHFFDESGGKIYDTSGLGLWLEPTGQCKQLRDDNGNIMRFYPDGRLCGIKSAAGGNISVSYAAGTTADASEPARVTYIQSGAEKATFIYYNDIEGSVVSEGATDSLPFSEDGGNITFNETLAGDIVIGRESVPVSGVIAVGKISQINNGDAVASFAYENDLLSSVSYTGLDEQLRFFYDDGRLVKISKFIGETESVQARFEYTGGRLSRVYGDDYAELSISYDDDGRVTALSRSAGGAPQTTVEYGDGFAVVTDELGMKYKYYLRNNGDLLRVDEIDTNGSKLYEVYPDKKTNGNSIVTTLVGSLDLTAVSQFIFPAHDPVLFSDNAADNSFTEADIRATLRSLACGNSTFDFYYNNKKSRICGLSPDECRLSDGSTAVAFSTGMLSTKTVIKDINGNAIVEFIAQEFFDDGGVKTITTQKILSSGLSVVLGESYRKFNGELTYSIEKDFDNRYNIRTDYTYDAYGNLLSKTIKDNTGTLSGGYSCTAEYSSGGEHMTSQTGDRGQTYNFTYAMPNNVLKTISDPTNIVTTFNYDIFKERLSSVAGFINGQNYSNSITYVKNKVSSLTASCGTYTFTYNDETGDLETVTAPSGAILYNGSVNRSNRTQTKTYGNGKNETIAYDKYGNVISSTYNGKTANFTYCDKDGSVNVNAVLKTLTDGFAGTTNTYAVDENEQTQINVTDITTDGKGSWKKEKYLSGDKLITAYTIGGSGHIDTTNDKMLYYVENYDAFGKPTEKINISHNSTFTKTVSAEYEKDKLCRTIKRKTHVPSCSASTEYTYADSANKRVRYVSNEKSSFPNKASDERSYTYDINGNVTSVKIKDSENVLVKTISYTYDSLNRLTSENNGLTGITTAYTYDANGNILTKTKNNVTTNYAYSATWGDLLTKYGTEDNIIYNNGYPTTYRGKTFSWDRNMLSSYTKNYGTTYSFTYDVYGKRIKTQYDSSQTSYFFYDGDRLIAEHMYMLNQSTPTLKVHYLYDNEGVCACKIYYKGTNNNEYAYYTVTKDIFGNIVRLDGEEGCVLKITYSAFGEPTYEIGEPMKVGITGLNAPQNYFRLAYKGYFYDKALKLYYLMSRYYDPETGRFISPDSARYLDPTVFGGLNLFAYKHNRPLNVNEIKTATTSSTYNYTNSTDLDISQALLIGAGAIGDVLDIAGTALDFVRVLKNTKAFDVFSSILTGISVGLDLLEGLTQGINLEQLLFVAAGNAFLSFVSIKVGTAIGGLIGGLPGAIFGTIFSILLATLFEDLFKQIFGI